MEDSGITVKKEGKNYDSELHYPYEQIKTDRITQVHQNIILLVLANFFSGLGVLLFILDLQEGRNYIEGAVIWSGLSIIFYP